MCFDIKAQRRGGSLGKNDSFCNHRHGSLQKGLLTNAHVFLQPPWKGRQCFELGLSTLASALGHKQSPMMWLLWAPWRVTLSQTGIFFLFKALPESLPIPSSVPNAIVSIISTTFFYVGDERAFSLNAELNSILLSKLWSGCKATEGVSNIYSQTPPQLH